MTQQKSGPKESGRKNEDDRKYLDQTSVDEQVSEWMDGESMSPQACQEILQDDQAIKTFESYHAISAALRQETSAHWQAGFSERIAQLVSDEPAILAPLVKPSIKRVFTGWAVAASVAVAFVIGVQTIPLDETTEPTGLVDSSQNSASQNPISQNSSSLETVSQDTMLAEYHVTDEERAELGRINAIFAEFAKRNTPSNNTSVPYVRVVSGQQVKTFRMTPQQFRRVMMELEMRNQEANQKAEQERSKANP